MAYPTVRFVARWAWLPLLGLALFLWTRIHRLERERQTALGEAAALNDRAANLRRQIAAAERKPTAVVTPGTGVEEKRTVRTRTQGWSDADALNDPEYGLVIARRQRRYAMANYRQAIDALHLAKADEDKLKQLIIGQWNARVDAADVLSHQENVSGDLRNRAQESVRAEFEQQIRTMLGDNAYATFKQMYDTHVANSGTWLLTTGLWDSGVPMSAMQETAFQRAQYEVSSQFNQAGVENPIDSTTGLRRSDLALLEKSGAFLSPEQLEFLRKEDLQAARYRALVAQTGHGQTTPAGGH